MHTHGRVAGPLRSAIVCWIRVVLGLERRIMQPAQDDGRPMDRLAVRPHRVVIHSDGMRAVRLP